ncbi:MAG: aspartate ammonia-lyase [Lentisphaerae bacterium RIFOXYB12_FULL_65_16]|nr:MAG: aspartate ammonia-lyase [Lentisphaerae bacterium RIFOXYA12_64_32]OGV86989.1 MAG: aspartate ammonia-lyase [Lentisphaerae bacterium RIFOXYB12_FULL_65_16]
MAPTTPETRLERDMLGSREVPADALWGIHTLRAMENFPISGRRVPAALVHAYGHVKLAAAVTHRALEYLDDARFEAVAAACRELAAGTLDAHIVVDAFQGGAGTSTNLNVCEVIANRALQLAGRRPGDYEFIDPLEHVNLHQSTNDTYPTALRIAVYGRLKDLELAVTRLQEACQAKEREFADVLCVGRTEMMDAVPTTLGRTFGAWAEALSRDRWRVYKCTERIRVVNLGGTAIGTGMGAPRDYIFLVVEELRAITGLPLARAENLFEATQNADVFVEVSGILKAHAVNLLKMSGDLRLLASGPDAGLGEIHLPELQAGSSIMPGKVNPVLPEMMAQAATQCMALDQAIALAAGAGQLELNAFLPQIAVNLLDSLDLLCGASALAADRCIRGITADRNRCRDLALRSAMMATVLVPVIGYHKAVEVAQAMRQEGLDLFAATQKVAGLPRERVAPLVEPAAVNALGFVPHRAMGPGCACS